MSFEENVRIRLGTRETIRIATSYEARISVFEQPASFALTIGDGSTAGDIIRSVPPNTPFQLLIGDRPQFSGFTSGYASTDESGTEVAIQGRDVIGSFTNSDIEKDDSFTASTHLALVKLAMERVNLLKPFGGGSRPDVIASNAENRVDLTGEDTDAIDDATEEELLAIAGTKGNKYRVIRTKVGERMVDLIRRHLDSAGLFMWGSASGDIIVGRPNPRQAPAYRIVRGRNRTPSSSNVTRASHRIDWSNRYSEVILFGKTTGRKYSRSQVKGGFRDDDLYNAGIRQTRVIRDADVTSVEHAEHLARKLLAKGRRDSFTLEYTISGHTAPSLLTGKPIVWAPDTIVDVTDDEYNLNGPYWIDTVTHRTGGGGTTTTIRLIEPETLIFGDGPPASATNASGKVTQAQRDADALAASLARREALYLAHKKANPFDFENDGLNGVRNPISQTFDRKSATRTAISQQFDRKKPT